MSENIHPTRQQLYDATPELVESSGVRDPNQISDEIRQQLIDADLAHMVASRDDSAAFCSYVLIDEVLGLPIQLAPMHREWHRLCDKFSRIVLIAALESGKTQQLSIGRTMWELGKNPNQRNVVVSATDTLAQTITGSIRKYLADSAELRRVFPKLKLDPKTSCTDHTFTVERPIKTIKDPSLQARGIFNKIQGPRIDRLVLDDILTWDNTHTKEMRDKTAQWVEATLLIRTRGNVLSVGNAWDIDDALHRWARIKGWFARRYPMQDPHGRSTWPEKWTPEFIAEKKELHPIEFERLLQCKPHTDMDSEWCSPDWIDTCLRRGMGRASKSGGQVMFTKALAHVPKGYKTFTGVDFGVQQKATSDLTSLCTILEHPNGSLELLNVDAGKWTAPEIVRRIIETHQRYHSIVMLENNAAQDFILQFTRSLVNIPMKNYTTDAKIRSPEFGIPSLFTELYNAKWIFPCTSDLQTNPEFGELRHDMLSWQPSQHTGDRLMSMFLARECARQCQPLPGRVIKLDVRSR